MQVQQVPPLSARKQTGGAGGEGGRVPKTRSTAAQRAAGGGAGRFTPRLAARAERLRPVKPPSEPFFRNPVDAVLFLPTPRPLRRPARAPYPRLVVPGVVRPEVRRRLPPLRTRLLFFRGVGSSEDPRKCPCHLKAGTLKNPEAVGHTRITSGENAGIIRTFTLGA